MTGVPDPIADPPPSGASTDDVDALLPLVYEDLRARARAMLGQERDGHTLDPTAVVHEAYAKLAAQDRARWQDRAHFEAVAAMAMRRILVDHARTRGAEKRGGGAARLQITLSGFADTSTDVDLLVLDEALERLRALDLRQFRIVELRFFGGLDERAVAERLGISRSTVQTEWRTAKAWLAMELRASQDDDTAP